MPDPLPLPTATPDLELLMASQRLHCASIAVQHWLHKWLEPEGTKYSTELKQAVSNVSQASQEVQRLLPLVQQNCIAGIRKRTELQ